jgi:hypothetical protein
VKKKEKEINKKKEKTCVRQKNVALNIKLQTCMSRTTD